MSVALMPALDVPPPPAPAPQGHAPRVEGAPEREWWSIYTTPPRAPAPFLVIRWRARAGETRARCDEPIYAGSLDLARGVVPAGLTCSMSKRHGKTDRLLETWSDPA